MSEYLIIIMVGYFILNLILAGRFQKVAALKGHGSEVHAFAMVLFFGIIGCIYVAALPDRVQQEQNQKIIDLLSAGKEAQ